MPVSRSLKQALTSAGKIAQQRDSKTIEPLHLLAAIVEERERGLPQLLREHGVTRQTVVKALNAETAPANDSHVEGRGTSDATVTSNRNLRFLLSGRVGVVMILAVSASRTFAQAAPDVATKQEIATAYRSKSGDVGTAIPGRRWERWRIKQVRGWSLHFKRLSEERYVGVIIAKYREVAKKRSACLKYEITETIMFPPQNVQFPPTLVVEPLGTPSCHWRFDRLSLHTAPSPGPLRACAGNKEYLRQAARLEAARLRMAEMGRERISYSYDSVFRATAHRNLYPWEYTTQIRDWVRVTHRGAPSRH
jgi:hypothetical protein